MENCSRMAPSDRSTSISEEADGEDMVGVEEVELELGLLELLELELELLELLELELELELEVPSLELEELVEEVEDDFGDGISESYLVSMGGGLLSAVSVFTLPLGGEAKDEVEILSWEGATLLLVGEDEISFLVRLVVAVNLSGGVSTAGGIVWLGLFVAR